MVKEFERTFVIEEKDDFNHHEQVPAVQKSFVKDVTNLTAAIREMGNPFTEDSKDLIVLDTKVIMPECVVNDIKNAKTTGEKQYDDYVKERLDKCSTPITETI